MCHKVQGDLEFQYYQATKYQNKGKKQVYHDFEFSILGVWMESGTIPKRKKGNGEKWGGGDMAGSGLYLRGINLKMCSK